MERNGIGSDMARNMYRIYVTSVIDPHNFWAHVGTDESLAEFKNFETALHQFCEKGSHGADIRCLYPGQTILAKNVDGKWLRGSIKTIESSEEVDILFIDYLTNEFVAVSDIIDQVPQEVFAWPQFAWKCKLNNVQPIASTWISRAKEEFVDLVLGRPLDAQLIEYDETRNQACLDIAIKLDEEEPMSLGDYLVEEGLAMPVDNIGLPDTSIKQIPSFNVDQLNEKVNREKKNDKDEGTDFEKELFCQGVYRSDSLTAPYEATDLSQDGGPVRHVFGPIPDQIRLMRQATGRLNETQEGGNPQQTGAKQSEMRQSDARQNDRKLSNARQNDPKLPNTRQNDPKVPNAKQNDPKLPNARQNDPKLPNARQNDPKLPNARQNDPKLPNARQNDPKLPNARQNDPKLPNARQNDPKLPNARQSDPKLPNPKQNDPKLSNARQNHPKLHNARQNHPKLPNAKQTDPKPSNASQEVSKHTAPSYGDLDPSQRHLAAENKSKQGRRKQRSQRKCAPRLQQSHSGKPPGTSPDVSRHQMAPRSSSESPLDGRSGSSGSHRQSSGHDIERTAAPRAAESDVVSEAMGAGGVIPEPPPIVRAPSIPRSAQEQRQNEYDWHSSQLVFKVKQWADRIEWFPEDEAWRELFSLCDPEHSPLAGLGGEKEPYLVLSTLTDILIQRDRESNAIQVLQRIQGVPTWASALCRVVEELHVKYVSVDSSLEDAKAFASYMGGVFLCSLGSHDRCQIQVTVLAILDKWTHFPTSHREAAPLDDRHAECLLTLFRRTRQALQRDCPREVQRALERIHERVEEPDTHLSWSARVALREVLALAAQDWRSPSHPASCSTDSEDDDGGFLARAVPLHGGNGTPWQQPQDGILHLAGTAPPPVHGDTGRAVAGAVAGTQASPDREHEVPGDEGPAALSEHAVNDRYAKVKVMLHDLQLEHLFPVFEENCIRDNTLELDFTELKELLKECGVKPGAIAEVKAYLQRRVKSEQVEAAVVATVTTPTTAPGQLSGAPCQLKSPEEFTNSSSHSHSHSHSQPREVNEEPTLLNPASFTAKPTPPPPPGFAALAVDKFALGNLLTCDTFSAAMLENSGGSALRRSTDGDTIGALAPAALHPSPELQRATASLRSYSDVTSSKDTHVAPLLASRDHPVDHYQVAAAGGASNGSAEVDKLDPRHPSNRYKLRGVNPTIKDWLKVDESRNTVADRDGPSAALSAAKVEDAALHPGALSRDPGASSRDTGALSRDTGAPSRDTGAPSRDTGAPSRDPGALSRDTGAPSRDTGAPSRDTGAPLRDPGAPSRDTGAPSRDPGALSRDTGAPSRDTGAPLRDTGAPLRDPGAPSRDTGAPSRDTGALSRDTGAPSRDTGSSSRDAEPGCHVPLPQSDPGVCPPLPPIPGFHSAWLPPAKKRSGAAAPDGLARPRSGEGLGAAPSPQARGKPASSPPTDSRAAPDQPREVPPPRPTPRPPPTPADTMATFAVRNTAVSGPPRGQATPLTPPKTRLAPSQPPSPLTKGGRSPARPATAFGTRQVCTVCGSTAHVISECPDRASKFFLH